MIKRLFGELPTWAKLENPLLRYEITRRRDKSESRLGRIAGWVLVLTLLIVGGYLYTTDGLQRGLQMPYTLDIWRIIVFPLVLIQLVMRIAGLSLGIGAINDERQRQTWDNLRATEQGAELSLRTRWVSVFYRLRGMLFTVIAARIILIVAILYELTSMQGGYLDLLAARAIPSLSVEIGVILLAAFMTAFIMMPITATGVDIAIGLFISTNVRNRAIASLVQILVVLFRVVSTVLLFWWAWLFMNEELALEGTQALGLLTGVSVFGDWGVLLSQLTRAGEMWAVVPYSIFLGIMMLLAVLVQVGVASALLMASAKSAEVRE